MEWYSTGVLAVAFVFFLLIAIPLALYVGGIFLALIPSTSVFYPSALNLASSVNTALGTILTPIVEIPFIAVIGVLGISLIVLLIRNIQRGSGGGRSHSGYR